MSFNLILFYLIASTILYLEPIAVIGELTFGIVWKLILMLVLFFPVIYHILKEKYSREFS